MSKCFGDFRKNRSKREFAIEKSTAERAKKMDWEKNDSYFATFVSPEQYIEAKLDMLQNEMYIKPTAEELEHLREMKTEANIDMAVRGIIDRHWRTW